MPMVYMPKNEMPKPGMPSGALAMLILRVLNSGPLHGYAIAQRIHVLSSEVLEVEEGSLYPGLHRMEQEGWITSEWAMSDTNRRVRYYKLTAKGKRQLAQEERDWKQVTEAVTKVLNFV